MFTSRLYGGSVVTSRPPRYTVPYVGSSKPPIIRRVVVLPQPDGPSMEKNSPSRMSSDRSSTAAASPNSLETRSRRTSISGTSTPQSS